MDIPQPLIEEINKKMASLFLGAGASKEANFPGSQELADRMADRTGDALCKILKGQPLDGVAQLLYMEQGFGEAWVRNFIIAELEKEQGKLLGLLAKPMDLFHKFLGEQYLQLIMIGL